MNEWQEFIGSQSPKLSDSNFICDASNLGLILVTGEDAQSFLQNQLSNDIAETDENHFQLSSYSTPKGRMLGIFRVVKIDNGYLLITPKPTVPALLQRLQMFVVQAKVNLADASDYFARMGIQTDHAGIIDNKILPGQQGEVVQSDSLIALHLGELAGQNRYLMLCMSMDEARSIWQDIEKNLSVSSFDAWRLSEIKAGIPVIYPETSEEFVAQMSNLNQLGGINFKKGCYPGQEIVARMQYLGKLKRRMFLAQLDTKVCPKPGDDLVASNAVIVDGSGKIVDAVIDDQGNCFCLFIAQIKKTLDGSLKLLDQPEVTINLIDLPYAV